MVALKLYGYYKHKLIIKQPGEIFFEYRYKKEPQYSFHADQEESLWQNTAFRDSENIEAVWEKGKN